MASTPRHHPAPDLPPGFSFDPESEELLSVYLRRKIARMPLPATTAPFFHDANVYAADPATLVAGLLPAPASIEGRKNWFFFSPLRPKSSRDSRKSRMVGRGKGTWKGEKGKIDVVDGEGSLLGHRHSFTYRTKSGGKAEWLMQEFRVDQEDDEGSRGEPVPVLCKIYQSPRFLQSASKSSSSRKRKATDERRDLASSSPVRRRLFPFSPPASTPPAEGPPAFEFLNDFLIPIGPQPEPEESQGETSPLNRSFSMADHAHSTLSCYGTTLLGNGGDWGIPPCAPDAENSGSWTGGHTAASCISGMESLAGLPTDEDFGSIAGLGQDASIYWCGEPSAPASSAASNLLCGVNSCNAIAAP